MLPFDNISGDPEQEYFVDGVSESLTTDLSRADGMLVIGRNTAFTYKGKAVDLKQIGAGVDTFAMSWRVASSAPAVGCA